MKIIFICGSLEPGKDGVEDYSRRLAATLINQGHTAILVALAESETPENKWSTQSENGISVPTLRFGKKQSWVTKKTVIEDYLLSFNPDVLSLQYVPYAFHSKGLALKLVNQLSSLKRYGDWHIMFHELWVGIELKAPLRNQVYALIQKEIIKRTIRELQPFLITTQTQLYRHLLVQMGMRVNLLPLFGNIPVSSKKNAPNSSESLIFVLFGGIHHSAKIEAFADWMKCLEKNHIKAEVHFVGSNGGELPRFEAVLRSADIFYKIHGRQDASEISRLFASSHIGITTTPYLLFEKSGSVAAMVEHGLPVLCIARDWEVTGGNEFVLPEQNVIKWHKDIQLNEVLNYPVKPHSIDDVGRRFISLINN